MVTITDRRTTDAFLQLYDRLRRERSACAPWAPARPCRRRFPPSGWKRPKKPCSLRWSQPTPGTRLQKDLRRKMQIDVPGTGIAFIVPVSSIGGKRALLFLTEHQTLT